MAPGLTDHDPPGLPVPDRSPEARRKEALKHKAGLSSQVARAVGPGTRDEDGEFVGMEVAEGDEIVFSKYGGTEIKVGTDDVLILRESDVLAKVVTTGSKGKKKLAGAAA